MLIALTENGEIEILDTKDGVKTSVTGQEYNLIEDILSIEDLREETILANRLINDTNIYILNDNPEDLEYSGYIAILDQISKLNNKNLKIYNFSNYDSFSGLFRDDIFASLNLTKFDTSKIIDMEGMFENLNVPELDLNYLDTSQVVNMDYLFNGCVIKRINFGNFNTSKVESMCGTFKNCGTSLDLNNFDTSNVKNMSYMFYHNSAQILDLSSFNTLQVTDMTCMFSDCKAELNLSSFNTSSVITMKEMFLGYRGKNLDLTNFDIQNVKNMESMFKYCVLETLDLSSFKSDSIPVIVEEMFSGCNIDYINLSNFDTFSVTGCLHMFRQSVIGVLDIRNFYYLNRQSILRLKLMFSDCKIGEIILNSESNLEEQLKGKKGISKFTYV